MGSKARTAPQEPSRALIVRLGHIGDVLLATPVAAALRASFPMLHIDWVVEPPSAPILRGNHHISEVIVWDRRGRWAAGLWRLLGLRRHRYGVAIDLHGLTKSAVVGLLAGARLRVGWAAPREVSRLFYNRLAEPGESGHVLDDYLSTAGLLGAETEGFIPVLPVAENDRRWADGFLHDHGLSGAVRFAAISPLTTLPAKQWGNDRFARLGDIIQRDLGLPVVLVGAASDAAALAREVAAAMKSPPISAVGRTTIRQLAALLQRAAVTITVDSGPMHIAAAVGTPVIGLFGPTDPRRFGPIGRSHRTLRAPMPCDGCRGHVPCRKRCPGAGDAPWGQCLRTLAVETVADAVRAVVKGG